MRQNSRHLSSRGLLKKMKMPENRMLKKPISKTLICDQSDLMVASPMEKVA
jgi:hypothetical protein